MKVWRETGKVSTGNKRSGRPRKLSDSDRILFYLTYLRNRRLTTRDIARMPKLNVKKASDLTIGRALNDQGLKARVAPKKSRNTKDECWSVVERSSRSQSENGVESLFLMRPRFAVQNKKKYTLD